MTDNKQIMPRFVEFINTASEKLAVELVSPDAVFHVPARPEPVHGPSGYLEIIGMMRGGFPDIQWTLEEMIAEGDMVAARFTRRISILRVDEMPLNVPVGRLVAEKPRLASEVHPPPGKVNRRPARDPHDSYDYSCAPSPIRPRVTRIPGIAPN